MSKRQMGLWVRSSGERSELQIKMWESARKITQDEESWPCADSEGPQDLRDMQKRKHQQRTIMSSSPR